VPVEADNYAGLAAKKGHLLYVVGLRSITAAAGPQGVPQGLLDQGAQGTSLADDVAGYALLRRIRLWFGPQERIRVRRNAGRRQLQKGRFHRRPDGRPRAVAEWNQIFGEVWRRYRDWFYVENMHGYDWGLCASSMSRASIRSAPVRPQLRDQRDDFRTHRPAYYIEGGTSRSLAPEVALPGDGLRWTGNQAGTASLRFTRARTKRKSIVRR